MYTHIADVIVQMHLNHDTSKTVDALLTTAYKGIKCDRSIVKVSVHHLADDWIRPTGMSSTYSYIFIFIFINHVCYLTRD